MTNITWSILDPFANLPNLPMPCVGNAILQYAWYHGESSLTKAVCWYVKKRCLSLANIVPVFSIDTHWLKRFCWNHCAVYGLSLLDKTELLCPSRAVLFAAWSQAWIRGTVCGLRLLFLLISSMKYYFLLHLFKYLCRKCKVNVGQEESPSQSDHLGR